MTSITEMAISYNYEYLAMFTDTGLLWIGSADLQVCPDIKMHILLTVLYTFLRKLVRRISLNVS